MSIPLESFDKNTAWLVVVVGWPCVFEYFTKSSFRLVVFTGTLLNRGVIKSVGSPYGIGLYAGAPYKRTNGAGTPCNCIIGVGTPYDRSICVGTPYGFLALARRLLDACPDSGFMVGPD